MHDVPVEPGVRPSDLWSRLARLDLRCHIVVENIAGRVGDPSKHWRIAIRPRGDLRVEAVRIEGEDLVHALAAALRAAGERGWAEAEGAGPSRFVSREAREPSRPDGAPAPDRATAGR